MEKIARRSLDELKAIFSWLNARESHLEAPTTILVGGWAVHSYNDYWGTIDIDIITNNKTKKSLKEYLLDHRDYHPDPETANSVYKETIHGRVIIDIANRGDDRFEGDQGKLDLSIVDGNTVIGDLEGIMVPIPSRTVLLMMKIKAAWDRSWRIENKKSDDLEWDRSKLIKDRADIISLIDVEDEVVDIDQLGKYFQEYQFLERVLDEFIDSKPAFEKYGIEREKANKLLKDLKSLIT